jgi:hypothetical protein
MAESRKIVTWLNCHDYKKMSLSDSLIYINSIIIFPGYPGYSQTFKQETDLVYWYQINRRPIRHDPSSLRRISKIARE